MKLSVAKLCLFAHFIFNLGVTSSFELESDNGLHPREPQLSQGVHGCYPPCPEGTVCVHTFSPFPVCTADKGYAVSMLRPSISSPTGVSTNTTVAQLRQRAFPIIATAISMLASAAVGHAMGAGIGFFTSEEDPTAQLLVEFELIADEIVEQITNVVTTEISNAFAENDKSAVKAILTGIRNLPDSEIPLEGEMDVAKLQSWDHRLDQLMHVSIGGGTVRLLSNLESDTYQIHVAPFYLLATGAHIGLWLERIRVAELIDAAQNHTGPSNTAEWKQHLKEDAQRFANFMLNKLQPRAISSVRDLAMIRQYHEEYTLDHQDYCVTFCWNEVLLAMPDQSKVAVTSGYRTERKTCTKTLWWRRCTSDDLNTVRARCEANSWPSSVQPWWDIRDEFSKGIVFQSTVGKNMVTPEFVRIYRLYQHVAENASIEGFDPELCWTGLEFSEDANGTES